MRGYSQHIVEKVAQADPELIGVRLAQTCIHLKYPVSVVAFYLGVTRQTVYHYFLGKRKPSKEREEKINELIMQLNTL
jgi:predicted transcriptional regulator